VEIKLLSHTHSILTKLEEETGVNPGWINNGGLFIANNKVRFGFGKISNSNCHRDSIAIKHNYFLLKWLINI
jgi:hypothetical protein